jgi:hypothetical protein
MTAITETATWAASITQLETSDFVLGGDAGPDNRALTQLANRTGYLKAEVEKRSLLGHSHGISDVTGLADALANRSMLGHAHGIGDTTGLQAALDAKAPYSHQHQIADTTGLQSALDSKAAISHIHGIGQVTGLSDALAARSLNGHGHGIADVTGLQAALDSKAPSSHGHSQDQIAGLVVTLQGKSNVGHSHATADVAGLDSALNLPNRIAIRCGVIAHGGQIPLPQFPDGTVATADQVRGIIVSMHDATYGSGSEATDRSPYCWYDGNRIVTCGVVITAGGGGANRTGWGSANYMILATR